MSNSKCLGTHRLRNWLWIYLSTFGLLLGVVRIGFSLILSTYFWGIVILMGVGVLLLIPIHGYYLEKQVRSRKDVVEEVAREILRILEVKGGVMKLSVLKKELHSSCRPYFNVATEILEDKGFIV